MKKTGFTLAEVLITLTIIGVVATMTLPALMNNVQEQQAKTAVKKGINTLTEAIGQQYADKNWDFDSLPSGTDNNAMTLCELLAERTEMDFDRTVLPAQYGTAGTVRKADYQAVEGTSTANYVVFLKDGSAFSFPKTTARNAIEAWNKAPYNTVQNDRHIFGVPIKYDINGPKAPNELSNCLGKAKNDAGGVTSEVGGTCTKANRYIKDQFSLRLRGKYAIPNGAATRWVTGDDIAK